MPRLIHPISVSFLYSPLLPMHFIHADTGRSPPCHLNGSTIKHSLYLLLKTSRDSCTASSGDCLLSHVLSASKIVHVSASKIHHQPVSLHSSPVCYSTMLYYCPDSTHVSPHTVAHFIVGFRRSHTDFSLTLMWRVDILARCFSLRRSSHPSGVSSTLHSYATSFLPDCRLPDTYILASQQLSCKCWLFVRRPIPPRSISSRLRYRISAASCRVLTMMLPDSHQLLSSAIWKN